MAMVKKDIRGRRSPRVPVDLEGRLEHPRSWPVRVQDLSLTGCLLQSPGVLDAGAIVDVRIDLAGGRLAAKARVVDASLDGSVWPSGTQYLLGLEFLGLPVGEQSDLRRFLERQRRGPDLGEPA